jgi:hypothetical protein
MTFLVNTINIFCSSLRIYKSKTGDVLVEMVSDSVFFICLWYLTLSCPPGVCFYIFPLHCLVFPVDTGYLWIDCIASMSKRYLVYVA